MKKNRTEKTISDQSAKAGRSKSREVSSRYLSPTSSTDSISGVPSPNQALSPIRQKLGGKGGGGGGGPSITSDRKHRSVEENGLIRGGLWPSSSLSSISSSKQVDTLADHLGNDRLKDLIERNEEKPKLQSSSNGALFLNRQQSCSEFRRFDYKEKGSSKENYRPSIGGSSRYTDKFRFHRRSSISSAKPACSSSSSTSSSAVVPGRLSVDENVLSGRSFRRNSDVFLDALSSESGSSELLSSTDTTGTPVTTAKNSSFSSSSVFSSSYLSSTASSRRSGINVSSRYLQDRNTKSCRWTSDSCAQTTSTSESSMNSNNFTPKNVSKRGSSKTGYGSATTQWALSPGRTGSPPISVENNGKPIESFSTLKPPSSPSRSKASVGSFLHGLFKSKRSDSAIDGNALDLWLLHNRLIQWTYVNARAETSNVNKKSQAEGSLKKAWASLTSLRSSVVQKRIQFEKEKLQLKLSSILHSEIKPLEAWGDIERQHLLAVSKTKDCLHSVVCRVPLIEGAQVDLQSASVAMRHSADLTASMKAMLSGFSPIAETTSSLLSELAEVVTREKLLLEECFELVETVSALEMQERSMKCSILQLKMQHQQQQQHQEGIVT